MRFRLPLVVICLLASTAFAQNGGTAKSPMEEAFSRLEYRSIGPAIMGGRIADVEGVPGDAERGLRRQRFRRSVENDERRRDVEADLRTTRNALDRRHRTRAE